MFTNVFPIIKQQKKQVNEHLPLRFDLFIKEPVLEITKTPRGATNIPSKFEFVLQILPSIGTI